MEKKFYTMKEFAQLTTFSYEMISKYVKNGSINSLKIGKGIRIPAQEVQKLLGNSFTVKQEKKYKKETSFTVKFEQEYMDKLKQIIDFYGITKVDFIRNVIQQNFLEIKGDPSKNDFTENDDNSKKIKALEKENAELFERNRKLLLENTDFLDLKQDLFSTINELFGYNLDYKTNGFLDD